MVTPLRPANLNAKVQASSLHIVPNAAQCVAAKLSRRCPVWVFSSDRHGRDTQGMSASPRKRTLGVKYAPSWDEGRIEGSRRIFLAGRVCGVLTFAELRSRTQRRGRVVINRDVR